MNRTHEIFQEMGFEVKTERLTEAVICSIARTYSLIARRLAPVYQRAGLTAASFNLLMLLKHGKDPESLTQHAAGEHLVVSPSDMTGLIDRLERKGIVRRLPGTDRRSKRLQITPKGSQLLDEVWPRHLEAVDRVAGSLSASPARQVVEALAVLRRGLAPSILPATQHRRASDEGLWRTLRGIDSTELALRTSSSPSSRRQ